MEEIYLSSGVRFNWKIKNFSTSRAIFTDIDVFSIGATKWKARIYPEGFGTVFDHLSLYLLAVDLTENVDTEFTFAVTSQTDRNNSVRKKRKVSYVESSVQGFGWTYFMPLNKLHDPSNGYIVDDTCVISIEVACWMKQQDSTLKESDPHKVPEAKRAKIKDVRKLSMI
ncbi:hypothetical protein MKX03_017903 [Papaver bracteatum]|nr:hypothetical protein MKX03_017903 [Papaver bracteatum]